MQIMDMNYKIAEKDFMPVSKKLAYAKDARDFSEFCEATCSNLFAYSPYHLQLDREAFLDFQEQADALKDRIGEEEVDMDELECLCGNLRKTYMRLLQGGWQTFVKNAESGCDSGNFLAAQLMIVAKYNHRLNNTESD